MPKKEKNTQIIGVSLVITDYLESPKNAQYVGHYLRRGDINIHQKVPLKRCKRDQKPLTHE